MSKKRRTKKRRNKRRKQEVLKAQKNITYSTGKSDPHNVKKVPAKQVEKEEKHALPIKVIKYDLFRVILFALLSVIFLLILKSQGINYRSIF